MTLTLTPAIVANAYEYLRSTPPFAAWQLPGADELLFKITRSKVRRAAFVYPASGCTGRCEIHMSQRHIAQSATLLALLAHEMVHLHHYRRGEKTDHGRSYRHAIKRISRIHGFDPHWFG